MPWVECQDGAYVYEYMKPTWRFGVSLEKDPSESGWFFVRIGDKSILKSGRIGKSIHWVLNKLFQPAEKSL